MKDSDSQRDHGPSATPTDKARAAEDVVARRKPYSPPAVHCLGNIAELTLGVGGSNQDAGHNSPAKTGHG